MRAWRGFDRCNDMTIQFNCPNCDSVMAFADKHVGKRAKCTTCGQRLIIPEKSGETGLKIYDNFIKQALAQAE